MGLCHSTHALDSLSSRFGGQLLAGGPAEDKQKQGKIAGDSILANPARTPQKAQERRLVRSTLDFLGFRHSAASCGPVPGRDLCWIFL
jgi:hypothetical protein